MPSRPPHICGCGRRVESGARCACKVQSDRERKARHDARRPSSRERGYTREWEKARAAYLANNPTCRAPGCGASATLVDHIMPHKGNQALFWNRANWQPLCTPCHSRRKQAEERRAERVDP